MDVEQLGNIKLLNCDCIDYLITVPDKYFELAIVDQIIMILLLLCQSIFVSLHQIKNI